ncbi:cation:proton antiporter [Salinarchaeum sp. IM2453]|uniref:proton-conducting transporter transmembrane domain-containing protein n=1 Tax=Salinarchaeum sp. IM2453 TaxID=2862870 RepID=UPI001C832B64|nr:proton-conducting transporter membrane subunit [Salinarchaeum sp. IM2453]QZA88974.1 cation:proton antiporter [Salinarchaeum sp. IM2453]
MIEPVFLDLSAWTLIGEGDPRPIAAVLVSAIAVALIVASYRYPNVRETWSVLAALTKFGLILSMLPGVLGGETYRWTLGEFVFGIEFALRVDTLGMVFALLSSFLWIFTAFYTAGYMRGLNEHGQTRFFAAFAASLSTAIGVAFAENLLVIFIFYELLSVVTYPLVAHDETKEARDAGRKYLLYTFLGGGFLVLGGTAIVFWLTNAYGSEATVTFGETAQHLAEAEPLYAQVAFAFLALGFGAKAAIMPLHSWLPDAMVAPTPVSGLLHAVAVVKTGAFGVSRTVLDVFEPDLAMELGMHIPLAALAAFSFLAASLIALRKDHLKRRLAYSTASQLSYIIMGIALLTPYGIVGGLLHIPAHAFMKLTLFFCAGAIHVATHTDYISNMAGIGKRMPLTLSAFGVAAAGMAGIPLIAGFVSKFYMVIGAVGMEGQTTLFQATTVEAHFAGIIFAMALIVSGVLNIAYFWPIIYTAFFESEDNHEAKPLIENKLGGLYKSYHTNEQEAHTDGGKQTPKPDDDEWDSEDHGYAVDHHPSDAEVKHVEEDPLAGAGDTHADDGHAHHGGPPPGGWERRQPWNETTWLMLMPITAIAIGAVILGVIPGSVGFLELAIEVAEDRTGQDLMEVFSS